METYTDLLEQAQKNDLFGVYSSTKDDSSIFKGLLVAGDGSYIFSYGFPLLQYTCKLNHDKQLSCSSVHLVISSTDDSGCTAFFPDYKERRKAEIVFNLLLEFFEGLHGYLPDQEVFKKQITDLGGYCDFY